MDMVKTLATWDTHLYADSVEWCPIEGLHHLFICGTYQLMEKTEEPGKEKQANDDASKRQGQLHLLALSENEEIIEKLQTIYTQAVLDCKWAQTRLNGLVLLAVANAVGELCIFSIIEGTIEMFQHSLKQETKAILPKQDEKNELLTLSLCWSFSEDLVRLATSDSQGNISVFRLNNMDLQIEHNWSAHQFEAWVVVFDPLNHQICYTGGDDAKLRIFDMRCDLNRAQVTNSSHSSGVTSLSFSHLESWSLLSGSYDENVRLWDVRQMQRKVGETVIGGGVWRLRWQPQTADLVLVAGMYSGFHLLCPKGPEVLAHYKEHESIAYGADWCHLTKSSTKRLNANQSIIGTCSFYDHKLCLSTVTTLNK